ncbi:MAG: flavin reductase [Sulfobacillus acidophilus]|uniref:Flavin reductase n=1 Tax=Sulfobacillus acidophilus TaxID=53633 RepID=A0A2T2WGR5_9FIRM|nr:MAG: flavin reductase [Sulfobacillus acidophilus]
METAVKEQVLRLFTYGLYNLTATHGNNDSHAHPLIDGSQQFALNVLGTDQKSVAQDFFRPSQRQGQSLNGHPFTPGPRTGAPLPTELPAWVECQVTDTVARGDHTVYVAEVIDAGVRQPEPQPLDMWNTGWFYTG